MSTIRTVRSHQDRFRHVSPYPRAFEPQPPELAAKPAGCITPARCCPRFRDYPGEFRPRRIRHPRGNCNSRRVWSQEDQGASAPAGAGASDGIPTDRPITCPGRGGGRVGSIRPAKGRRESGGTSVGPGFANSTQGSRLRGAETSLPAGACALPGVNSSDAPSLPGYPWRGHGGVHGHGSRAAYWRNAPLAREAIRIKGVDPIGSSAGASGLRRRSEGRPFPSRVPQGLRPRSPPEDIRSVRGPSYRRPPESMPFHPPRWRGPT